MSLHAALPYAADVLVIAGMLLLSFAVYGLLRAPGSYLKLHAASAGILFGLLPILGAAALTGGREVALRAALIAVLLLLTAPISGHVIAKAVHQRESDDVSD